MSDSVAEHQGGGALGSSLDAETAAAAAQGAAAYGAARYIQPASLLTQFNPQRILPAAGQAGLGIGADPAMTGPMYVFVTAPDINLGVATLDQQQDNYDGSQDTYPFLGSGGASSLAGGIGSVERDILGLGGPMAPDVLALQLTGGQGFIKLLTNMCRGYPASDVTLDVLQMHESFDGAKQQLPKSTLNSRQDGTLVLEFEEWAGTPVLLTIKTWVDYIEAVGKGYLAPKLSAGYLANKVLDYACSIYAFQLLSDGATIEWGARWTGCYPTAVPHSAWGGQAQPSHQPVNYQVPFAFQFYEPMDPPIFMEFNEVAGPPASSAGGALSLTGGVSVIGGSALATYGGQNPFGIASPNRSAYYLVFDSTAASIATTGF